VIVPIYAFECSRCGPFDLSRPMAQASDPAACPGCSASARRLYTPPGLALLARPVRGALDREEKSAHEPEVVRSKTGRPLPHLQAHGHGHLHAPPWAMSH
jgi:putative FmdB family regulatory protein